VPEILDPVFAKTSPKRSFRMTENERFGLVFVKTGSINSGNGLEACLFWCFIDMIVVRVKVSRGIVSFSPKGIDSADTCQPPNGVTCMDISHLLANNPARQYSTVTPLYQ
jgi:hypothetical protein